MMGPNHPTIILVERCTGLTSVQASLVVPKQSPLSYTNAATKVLPREVWMTLISIGIADVLLTR